MTQFIILQDVRATPGDDDGSVLMKLGSGTIFSLNGVGAKIWTMLEQGLALEDIVQSITWQYDVPAQLVQEDLQRFIHTLECKGLVRATDAQGLLGTREQAHDAAA